MNKQIEPKSFRDLFCGYYSPSEEEFNELFEKAVFILDTNELLNLYKYSQDVGKEFLEVLRKLDNRLWIPYQVAFEFQKNLFSVIQEEKEKFNNLNKDFQEIQLNIKEKLKKYPSINSDELLVKFNQLFAPYLESIKEFNQEKYNSLTDEINDLFSGKIGNPFAQQKDLDTIYEEGESRYKNSHPPGFKDSNKSKEIPYIHNGLIIRRQYGDLIVWKQILAKISESKLTHVVFITSDGKEDWWRKEQGKTISPRPELIEEAIKSGAKSFYMYSSKNFLKHAREYWGITVEEESIRQVEGVKELTTKELLLKSLKGFTDSDVYSERGNSLLNHLFTQITKKVKDKPKYSTSCPECGSLETKILQHDVVAPSGEPANATQLICSSCGLQRILQYESLDY
jgi:hypothetical protein